MKLKMQIIRFIVDATYSSFVGVTQINSARLVKRLLLTATASTIFDSSIRIGSRTSPKSTGTSPSSW